VIGSGLILYFSSVYKSRKIVHVKNVVATKSFTSEAIEIWSENRKESFTVNVRDLLFLEKKDNYVIIYYENQDSIHKKLIRTSLKDIEDNYIKYPLYRCHVSYIINLQKVANYSGNSKGLRLVLSSGGEAVPVSSRYYDTIISEMNKLALQAPADI
jgi:DNA-binding LytR/AlgR family response regulator